MQLRRFFAPLGALTREEAPSSQPAQKGPPGDRPRVTPADLGLTERQVEVLALMMTGKSNKARCRALDLALPTVKNHVTAIFRAIKVTNRTEAVIALGSLGLKWATGSAAPCPQ